MPGAYKSRDDIKRKLREIKRFELKVRSDNYKSYNIDLVWDKFFDLKDYSNKNVRYTIDKLSLMTKEEFADVIKEYFYQVYCRFYSERGMADTTFIDIDILNKLGLSMDSGYDDVIKAFREHVKDYHPDNGGDVDKFLEIMDSYNRFRK